MTTFGGLAPIILETSSQAFYLIPMAISLGFGIVFATAIILVIVPCLYLALEDIRLLTVKGRTVQEVDVSKRMRLKILPWRISRLMKLGRRLCKKYCAQIRFTAFFKGGIHLKEAASR